MKFILLVLSIALASYLAELVFPWWTAALCAFVLAGLIPTRGFRAFLAGFLGVGLLWFFGALIFSIQTDYILTQKVAELMQFSTSVLIMITALIGALTGGLGALTGHHLRMLLRTRKKNRGSRYHSSY